MLASVNFWSFQFLFVSCTFFNINLEDLDSFFLKNLVGIHHFSLSCQFCPNKGGLFQGQSNFPSLQYYLCLFGVSHSTGAVLVPAGDAWEWGRNFSEVHCWYLLMGEGNTGLQGQSAGGCMNPLPCVHGWVVCLGGGGECQTLMGRSHFPGWAACCGNSPS